MPVLDAKFSTFSNGGALITGDVVVGLRDGVNTRFSYTVPSSGVTQITASTGITCTPNPIIATGTIGLEAVANNRLLGNISGVSAAPVPLTLSSFIDSSIGNTQGNLLYRNASDWVVLSPGTSGQLLQTGGAGANPSWTTTTFPATAGTAGNILISNGTNYIGSTSLWPNTVGSVGKILRSDGTTNTYSTATFADTYSASSLLYSNGANTVTGLATANSSVLVTTSAGVPVFSGSLTDGQLIIGSTGATPVVASLGAGTGIATTVGAGSLSVGLASVADQRLLANISGGSAAPTANTLTAVIDACIGSTQGNILYRDAGSWTVLAPGTSGYFLKTQGAGANPVWAAETGTGTVTSIATNNGITGGTITTTGTIGLAAIANNTLLANISGGSLYPSSTTLTGLIDSAIGGTQGDILYRNATVWTVLPAGTSGKFLRTNGAGANPSWEAEAGTGTVTSISAGTGITCTPNPITTTGTIALTTPVTLANGGSGASLTASNGGIVYSNATTMAILSGTATAGLALLSGASTTPSWSTKPPITQVNVQVITATGSSTYTPTTGMKYCIVELVGGGGGGGGGASAAAGQCGQGAGGGGAGYCRKLYTSTLLGATATVVIGTGGAGGTAGNNAGSAGVDSTFTPAGAGSVLTAAKGNAGAGGASYAGAGTAGGAGGTGGTGTNGDINITGAYGTPGLMLSGANGIPSGGAGGASIFGQGGVINNLAAAATVNGLNYGSGGAGGFAAGGANQAGGAGAQGVCIITEFISV